MTACTYISGSICLTANNIFYPRQESLENDKFMIDVSFTFLEDMIRQAPFEPLKRIRNIYEELLRHAPAAPPPVAIHYGTDFQNFEG